MPKGRSIAGEKKEQQERTLSNTFTIREVAALARVSTQRVHQAIKSYKWEEKNIAYKEPGEIKWRLTEDAIEVLKARKGSRGNPMFNSEYAYKREQKIRESNVKKDMPLSGNKHGREKPGKKDSRFYTGPVPKKRDSIFIDD